MTLDDALAEAVTRWGAGDRDGARQLAHQVLRVSPAHPGALNIAGCAAFESGDWGVALALLEKAARTLPGDVSIQTNLARSEFATGQRGRALQRAEFLGLTHAGAAALWRDLQAQLAQDLRRPALAGSFYSADPAALAAQVDGFLDHPVPPRGLLQRPKVLVLPHAGHVYSGRTAGAGWARVRPFSRAGCRDEGERATPIRRVVLLGPAHRVPVRGIGLPGHARWATPLGPVVIDLLGAEALADLPFVSPRPDAHAPEHCLEVQLPFIQRALGDVEVLPLIVGDASPAQVGQVIERLWGGPETLIVISTDLSHYHPHDEAVALDEATCQRVRELKPGLNHEQACGATPLNALLARARERGLRIEQIERCTSGDTAGDRDRVVGYASFALFEPSVPASPSAGPAPLPAEAMKRLLALARSALHEACGAAALPRPPVTDLMAPGAAFVTLTRQGELRGCIGSLQAHRPLAEDVVANAAAAALRDPRFAPVQAAEVEGLRVEVSVLGEPQPLAFASEAHALWQLEPGRDGLILEAEVDGRSHRSTYLPQVWSQIGTPRAFVAHLKVKAGLPFDAWPASLRLWRYRAHKVIEA